MYTSRINGPTTTTTTAKWVASFRFEEQCIREKTTDRWWCVRRRRQGLENVSRTTTICLYAKIYVFLMRRTKKKNRRRSINNDDLRIRHVTTFRFLATARNFASIKIHTKSQTRRAYRVQPVVVVNHPRERRGHAARARYRKRPIFLLFSPPREIPVYTMCALIRVRTHARGPIILSFGQTRFACC